MKKTNQKGFSLIELLIVVVIIGIIAAIAIPNLIAARRSANEGSAQSTLRTLHGAEVTYAATTGDGNYGDLTELNGANLIDTVLAAGSKSGYAFAPFPTDSVPGTSQATFTMGAAPQVTTGVTQTGTRNFCIATEGILASTTTLSTVIAADGDCDTTAGWTPVGNS